MKLLILNGPNINMLGLREPEIYGKGTYEDLKKLLEAVAAALGIEIEIFQSNHEGVLVDKIQDAFDKFQGIVFNPAAYTHTSVALHDAIKAVGLPTVEVHISDITKREAFRKVSYIRPVAVNAYVGLGFQGYVEAMNFLVDYLK